MKRYSGWQELQVLKNLKVSAPKKITLKFGKSFDFAQPDIWKLRTSAS
jgi:hypothetical protein